MDLATTKQFFEFYAASAGTSRFVENDVWVIHDQRQASLTVT